MRLSSSKSPPRNTERCGLSFKSFPMKRHQNRGSNSRDRPAPGDSPASCRPGPWGSWAWGSLASWPGSRVREGEGGRRGVPSISISEPRDPKLFRKPSKNQGETDPVFEKKDEQRRRRLPHKDLEKTFPLKVPSQCSGREPC